LGGGLRGQADSVSGSRKISALTKRWAGFEGLSIGSNPCALEKGFIWGFRGREGARKSVKGTNSKGYEHRYVQLNRHGKLENLLQQTHQERKGGQERREGLKRINGDISQKIRNAFVVVTNPTTISKSGRLQKRGR